MKSAISLLVAFSSFGIKLALELEAPVKLPHVPKVRNPGADGFPSLISVQSAMSDFAQGKDTLNHHASVLGLHLKKVEKEETEKIIEQNHVYEEKLRSQEEANQVIVRGNAKLAKQIVQVRKLEDKLSALTKKEQELVRSRRDQYAKLKKEFLEGQQRVDRALESVKMPTDDDASNQEREPPSFLEIAEESERRTPDRTDLDDLDQSAGMTLAELDVAMDPRPTKKQVDGASSLKTDAQPQSTPKVESEIVGLAEVESETGALVHSLAAELAKLHEDTTKTFDQLKESFKESYKAGVRRHTALLEQESALKDSLKSAKQDALKLKGKYKHLTSLRKVLEQLLAKNSAFGNFEKMAAGL